MMADLALIFPEITLLVLAGVALLVVAFDRDPLYLMCYRIAQAALFITLLLVLYYFPDGSPTAFHDSFINDAMSAVLKAFICGITLIVFLYSYEDHKESRYLQGEYFILGLFAVLGMMIMASAHSLLSVYLGLELLSLSLYVMVAMQRNSVVASEAAVKYFVLGALASGMLLYGISIIYGLTGSLHLATISDTVAVYGPDRLYLVYGMIFMIVGIAFKLGAAPFHMWVPDVYQGAPTPVTLFIGSAPKLAVFAMTMRILVDGLLPLFDSWYFILLILSVLSIAIGNIVAIVQTNIKRMLAYSAIAHTGFLLLGFVAGTPFGFAAAMFYVVSYALMSMGAFGMVILLSRRGFSAENLSDFSGLSKRSPWFAFMMLCFMFSMAGVPPFLGFWSKWFVLKELVTAGFVGTAVVAIALSVVGAYYYLRIIKLMYFDEPASMTAIKASRHMRVVLGANGLAILLFGLMPEVLMNICLSALGG